MVAAGLSVREGTQLPLERVGHRQAPGGGELEDRGVLQAIRVESENP